MGLRINTNIAALNAHRNLQLNDSAMSSSLDKLSSGLRINRAADDAAGLAISEKMTAQINGLDVASRNAQDGISMLQTAEGGLNEVSNILQRMRQLAVQAANDTMTTEDRLNLQAEMNQLSSEIDRIAESTEFNTVTLLNGGSMAASGLTFQVGANAGQGINVIIDPANSSSLTVDAANIAIDSADSASAAITNVETALGSISTLRAKLGAYINRLEHTISNLDVQSENLSAARSRIRDLDVASEVVHLSRSQILNQSSTAMLAQANQAPQAVLSLLKGG